jgi:putative spermidine/putrescine transport system permease protein
MNPSTNSNVDVKGAPRKGGAFHSFLTAFPLPLAPIFIFLLFFFLWPITALTGNAFKSNEGAFTFSNISMLFQDPYRMAFKNSISLGLFSALVGAIPGLAIAIAIEKQGSRTLKKFISSISGVLANTGGVPLAFMFLAAFGPAGLVITALKSVGIDLYGLGFNLFSFTGLIIVYAYFQIPIMVIVITPALTSLRKEWKDSAASLGASRFQYWLKVGIPILMPSFIACYLLLFASAFSAFATARAMTVGNIALVPLQIGSLVDGNVTINQANLGYALAFGMIVVSLFAMIPYIWIQSRTSKWQNR